MAGDEAVTPRGRGQRASELKRGAALIQTPIYLLSA